MKRVYLDYAATAPLRPEVLEAMLPWLGGAVCEAVEDRATPSTTHAAPDGFTPPATHTATDDFNTSAPRIAFGNANTLYREGRRARQALEQAREQIAAILNARSTEIVFTSGGTEANNAAIAGITRAVRAQKGREKGGNHVLTSAFEHHAVSVPVQALKRDGWQTSTVSPQRDGFVHHENMVAVLRDDTTLVSIMTANNEIGTVQPIARLAALAHERGALFHTDAVQALGKLPLDLHTLEVDAASFSAHKIGGPMGIGMLYLKNSTPFLASMLGGGQEGGRRSGTQNIAGALGFARALELAEQERETESARLACLRDQLAEQLTALDARITLTIPVDGAVGADVAGKRGAMGATAELRDTGATAELRDTGATAELRDTGAVGNSGALSSLSHLPHILSLLVSGFESETLILALDEAGFAVSGGSACSTGSLEPSHVLMSLGLSRDEAYGVLRLSLGQGTTAEECAAFVAVFASLVRAH